MSQSSAIIAVSMVLCLLVPSNGVTILVIGDSNTEHGYITTGLADTLRKWSGITDTASGYYPLNSGFYQLVYHPTLMPGLSVSYPTSWKLYDMFEGSRLTPPFLSPNGHWLKTSSQNETVTVTFKGNGVDVYWLGDSLGGSFGVIVDSQVKATVATAGLRAVQKTVVTGLTSGSHTMLLRSLTLPANGSVTLLGFDAHYDKSGQTARTAVHNWGNGYCSTADFINIDSTIFVTGLRQLAPDVTVILLGTNDHIQDQRSAADFKVNLKRIINRIKASGISTNILLTSTFMTNGGNGPELLPQYLATSWPQAASETGVQYWDMSTWFGPFSTAQMMDAYHCNQAGGTKIGKEMLRQIVARFRQTHAIANAGRGTLNPSRMSVASNGFVVFDRSIQGPVTIERYAINGRLLERITKTDAQKAMIGQTDGIMYDGVSLVKASGKGWSTTATVAIYR